MSENTTNPEGRPPADLKEALRKLSPFLQVGYSFYKACQLANLPFTTYLYYYKNNDSFRNEIEYERAKVNIIARQNIISAITKKKSVMTSFEWLDRMEKDDFSKRTEVTGKDGEPIGLLSDGQALATVLKTFDIVKSKLQDENVQKSNSK